MIANSHSTTKRHGHQAIFSLFLIVLISGVVAGCGGASARKPTGRWELVALAGDVSNRATQSLPTQIGSEIEFLKKGNLAITGGETNLGTLQYSFPDETHLMIESSMGLQEVVAYILADNVLALNDGALTLTLKAYKELEPTAANLAGAWSIPFDDRGEQADSVPLGNDVSDILAAVLGGETEKQERCLVTDRRDVSAFGAASYSPTLIDFGPDKTLTMQDRFGASWQGQFEVTSNSLTVTAEKTPPASGGVSFAAIHSGCLVVRLTNARLILGSVSNNLQIEYVRSDASSEPVAAESPTAVVELYSWPFCQDHESVKIR